MQNQESAMPLKRIQWVIWVILYIVYALSMAPYMIFWNVVVYAAVTILSSVMIIYGNASYLLPNLYERNKKYLYFFVTILFLGFVTVFRSYGSYYLYNKINPEKDYPYRWTSLYGATVTTLLVYVSSILFYMAINYIKLRQKQGQLQKKQAEAELNLLKAQVQPHFLFNTLNNIYFFAQRESSATASMLEKLSLIMRYFVDEAPKDLIPLQTELSFINNYIALEKTRMRYPLSVSINEIGEIEHIHLPPMLIIPLVENVFKHGIDKRKEDNFIWIDIENKESQLIVTVKNKIAEAATKEESGKGLTNLRNRMQLLYADKSSLKAAPDDSYIFTATLSIPL